MKDLVCKKRPAKKLVNWYISLYYWWDSFHQYSQITTVNFNKNSSSCKYQSSSKIQRASRKTESRESKTGKVKE